MRFKSLLLSATAALTLSGVSATTAHANSDPYIGEIMSVGYQFCPRGWADTNGQLLPISSNTALFSLLGTTYGGDGRTTFGLPDLRSRMPMGQGSGPGLASRNLGSTGGAEQTTLTVAQMPSHSHQAGIRTVNTPPNSPTPFSNVFTTLRVNAFVSGENPGAPGSTTKSPRFMNPNTMFVADTGGNQPFQIVPPYQTVRYCIALQGIFPSRN